MNTQPIRRDITDQPWLGSSIEPNGATAARGFLHPSTPDDQPGEPMSRAPQSGLSLALQPRHNLACGALCAAEAALPAGILPADPEDAAHLSGWLLETACHEAQDWNAMRGMTLTVAVELPLTILHRDRMVTQTKRALARSNLVPWHLEIQLPEQALTDGNTDTLLSLAALRDLGVGIGINRFGSIAASLRTLQRLPLTSVKLDPTLIRDMTHDRDARTTVKAAIALAHALGATTLATQVETVTQRDILADLNCDDAQGPLFGGTLRPDVFHASLLLPVLR